jgi:hypothetical protein
LKRYPLKIYLPVNLNKILCFIYKKKKIKQNVYQYFKFKADLFYQTMFRKICIQLICIAKTRNGKLVALAWKQPLQEKLDIDSEESDLHALNIICDTDKDSDDFCVDFMDEEDNWRDVFLLSEIEC